MSILEVNRLRVVYGADSSSSRKSKKLATQQHIAVNEVSFSVEQGESFGIVGESGSGKTTVAHCVAGFVRPTSGSISFSGEQISGFAHSKRDRRLQLVFQDPYSSLNPSMTIRQALSEPIKIHRLRPKNQIDSRVEELADLVGLGPTLLENRPKQLSGGQRQRASIARALALEPDLLIADEPVSALDVSVQAVVLNLFARLRSELGMSMVFISHDIAVVSYLCNRIGVMKQGELIEMGKTEEILQHPTHPYTQQLLKAVPFHPWATMIPGHSAEITES